MFEVKVDVSGLDRLIKQLEEAEPEAVEAMAKSILEDADKRVPVDEGDLKASGRVEVRRKGGKAEGIVRYGGRAAPHAGPVEFGEGKGRRFLRDAAIKGRKKHAEAAARVLRKRLKG